PNALLAVLEPGLDLPHPRRDVADLLDQRVARRPQRRLGGDLERLRRHARLRELPADLAHEARVLRDLLHQPVAIVGRLRQAVHARLHLGCGTLLASGGDEERERQPRHSHRATAGGNHNGTPPTKTWVTRLTRLPGRQPLRTEGATPQGAGRFIGGHVFPATLTAAILGGDDGHHRTPGHRPAPGRPPALPGVALAVRP